jgi:hypothetical protein
MPAIKFRTRFRLPLGSKRTSAHEPRTAFDERCTYIIGFRLFLPTYYLSRAHAPAFTSSTDFVTATLTCLFAGPEPRSITTHVLAASPVNTLFSNYFLCRRHCLAPYSTILGLIAEHCSFRSLIYPHWFHAYHVSIIGYTRQYILIAGHTMFHHFLF